MTIRPRSTAIIAVIGVALRVWGLVDGRSLWMDEALLALNICTRSFADLWRPLDMNQAAPVGFLMIERLAVALLGPGEFALRLFPFLASIATIGLAFRVARDNIDRETASIAMALTALAPGLLYYGAEVKQYASDAAIALGLIALAAEILRDRASARRLWTIGVAGVLAVWFSHPSVFVLAGAGSVLLVDALREDRSGIADRGRFYRLIAVAGCWAISFGMSYAASLRSIRANAFLNEYWKFAFLPFPPRSLRDAVSYPSTFLGLFDTAFRDHRAQFALNASILRALGFAAMAGWLAGVAALRGRGRLLGLLLAPIGFAFLATVFHRYPLRGRMVIFDVGPNLILIAAGLAAGLRSPRWSVRWPALGASVVLLLTSLMPYASALLRRQPARYGIGPVVASLARSVAPGDRIFVDLTADATFRYARAFGPGEGNDRLGSAIFFGEPTNDAPSHRVWIVSEGELTTTALDLIRRSGRPLVTIEAREAMIGRPARATLLEAPGAGEGSPYESIPFTTKP